MSIAINPERLKEIRSLVEKTTSLHHRQLERELLAGIDTLQTEISRIISVAEADYARLEGANSSLRQEIERLKHLGGALTEENEKLKVFRGIVGQLSDEQSASIKLLFEENEKLKAENNKLREAVSNKLTEDSDYCREYSAIIVLKDENNKLAQKKAYLEIRIDKLREVMLHVQRYADKDFGWGDMIEEALVEDNKAASNA